MVSIIHSVGLLLSMFLLSPLMAEIPLAALSGVLMVTAWRMNEWETIHVIFSKRLKTSIAQFLVTMLATVVFDLTTAILIGVGLSMVLFVLRASSDLRIEVEKLNGNVGVIYINGMLFFGTQEKITATVNKLIGEGVNKMVFSLRGVSQIDHSGAEELQSILEECRSKGVKISLAGIQPEVETMLDRVGIHYKEYSSAISAAKTIR